MAGLSEVPTAAESDTMSGIEPLGSMSETSAGFSPAHDGRTVSARSSANTAELLASTLLPPVNGISDTEVSPQFDAARTMHQNPTGGQTEMKDKPSWQDEDGQTVSSIFSPLSGTDTNFSKGMSSSCPPERTHTDKDKSSRSVVSEGQHIMGEKNAVKSILHSSLLTPQKIERFQSDKTSLRTLTFRSDTHTHRVNAASSDVEDRRRHFVAQFNQNPGIKDGVDLSQSGMKERTQQGLFEDQSRAEEGFRAFTDEDFSNHTADQLMAKDFEEKRFSADSTLTEQLLRGVTPMEDTSPYSVPYDSGLASNFLSYPTNQQSHSMGFHSESHYLQEALEKEKYRRKHCELQIKELQSKLLENQQLLAVAEATRRKKDSMITQVEKNFSKIMSDWKTKDKEKLETLERLKKECDKQEHISRMREQELQVQEKENVTLRQQQERLQSELNHLKEESTSQVEDAKHQMQISIQQMEKTVEEKVAAEQHVRKVQEILAKERTQWREKEVKLTERLTKMEEDFDKKQKEFMVTLEKETEAAQQVLADSNTNKKKLAEIKEDLSRVLQEKESLSLELNLKQAQFEASLQKQEMDWKEQLERLIQERIETIQGETNQQMQKQKDGYHQQIAEMTERHQEEMRRLRGDHASEMKMKESRYQSSIQQFQTKLDQSHQEVLKLTTKLEHVQKHRSTIIQKMQSFLQSYTSDTMMMLGQLDSSPAVSSQASHVSNLDTSSPTPRSSHPAAELPFGKSADGSHVLQGGRLSPDQMFSQFLSTLSSDGGYQTLPAATDAPLVSTSRLEKKDDQSFHGTGNWSFMDGPGESQQTMPYEQDQPLPIKYTTVVPSIPPLHAAQGTHFREGMLPSVTAPSTHHTSMVSSSLKGKRASLDSSRISNQSAHSSEKVTQRHHPIAQSDFTNAQTHKLYQYERPEIDVGARHPLQVQGSERHSQHGGAEHNQRTLHDDQAQFVPLVESEDVSLSEHPLDNTSHTLGDLSERMGKEEERRQLLQQYLKELLHQTSWSQQQVTANTENRDEVYYSSRDVHKTRFSQKGAHTMSSSLPQTQDYHSQPVIQEQPTNVTVPGTVRSSLPSSKSPVTRDVLPDKERIYVSKESSTRSVQRSVEDSSKSGRRSANSSGHHGRSSGKEQSSFGTSTPKKKGNPQPAKPPTRKSKSGKNKPGVWR